MTRPEVVKKLRSLRAFERTLRGGVSPVFDEFFALREGEPARYPLVTLSILDHESRSRAFEEYLAQLFAGAEAHEGRAAPKGAALSRLAASVGLPAEAGPDEVRREFRRTMLELHPDQGGDSSLAAELIELYRKAFE